MSTRQRLRVATILVSGLVGLLVGTMPARAFREARLAPDLAAQVQANPSSTQKVRVIVQFTRPNVDAVALAGASGGSVSAWHSLINGATLTLPQKAVTALSERPEVAWVSPDRDITAQWDYANQSIGADEVWASTGFNGSGVRVAVLDTGIYSSSADLKNWKGASRLAAWKDLVNSQKNPYDDNGHGTHVASIVLGNGSLSNRLFGGAAPDAELVAVKVLDGSGLGKISTVIGGLDWCVTNRNTLKVRVINLSLGLIPRESYTTDPLCTAVRRAVQAGLVVVCAAGNNGTDSTGRVVYGGIHCPGNEPSAITVGALNTRETANRADDTVCTYSSRGPTYLDHLAKPDLVAPGNKVVAVRAPGSTLDVSYPENRVAPSGYGSSGDSVYSVLSGTSMAAPQVAGAVALMLHANPGLTPNTVKGILMYTAQRLALTDADGQPLSQELSFATQGVGSVNVVGAVEVATKIDLAVAAGSNWLRAPLSNQSMISGYSFPWVQQVIWGDQCIWGDQVIWGDSTQLQPQSQSVLLAGE